MKSGNEIGKTIDYWLWNKLYKPVFFKTNDICSIMLVNLIWESIAVKIELPLNYKQDSNQSNIL